MTRFFQTLLLAVSLLFISPLQANVSIPSHQSIEEWQHLKAVDRLLFIMQKRLSIMHEAARWKWNNNFPIEDLEREALILKNMIERAERRGIDTKWAKQFFQAQMDAAKVIQNQDFDYWAKQQVTSFPEVCDLHDELRPYFMKLTQELLRAISDIFPNFLQAKEKGWISEHALWTRDEDSIPKEAWEKAIAPLFSKSLDS